MAAHALALAALDGRQGEGRAMNRGVDQGRQPEQSREMRSIADALKMGIDNPVAAIGDKNVAVLALSDHHLPGNAAFGKGLDHRPLRRRQSERDHLDRQRKLAEHV